MIMWLVSIQNKDKKCMQRCIRKLPGFVDLNSAGLLLKTVHRWLLLFAKYLWILELLYVFFFVEMYVKSMKHIDVKYNQNVYVSGQCGTIVPKYTLHTR